MRFSVKKIKKSVSRAVPVVSKVNGAVGGVARMAKQLPPPYGTAAAAVEQQTQVVKGGISAYKSGDISPLLVSVVPKQAQPAAKVLAQAVSKKTADSVKPSVKVEGASVPTVSGAGARAVKEDVNKDSSSDSGGFFAFLLDLIF